MSDSESKSAPSNERLNEETLSAMLDGEAGQLELRRILAASDDSLDAKWARLNLAQVLLHGESVNLHPVSPDFASRVMQEVNRDPSAGRQESYLESDADSVNLSANDGVFVAPWAQGLAKLAVAASVAVVFVFALQSAIPGVGTDTGSSPLMASKTEQTPAGEVVQSAREQIVVDDAAQKRLRDYIASMTVSDDEPVRIEHIQDSPLYRLVSETIEVPSQR